MHCPSCGGMVIFTEGCELCVNCGWSPCGSAFLQGESEYREERE
jgi:hypothetical protein